MIIPTNDGRIIDTDKMTDLCAELTERTNSLYEFARAHNISLYIQTLDSSKRMGGAFYTRPTTNEPVFSQP